MVWLIASMLVTALLATTGWLYAFRQHIRRGHSGRDAMSGGRQFVVLGSSLMVVEAGLGLMLAQDLPAHVTPAYAELALFLLGGIWVYIASRRTTAAHNPLRREGGQSPSIQSWVPATGWSLRLCLLAVMLVETMGPTAQGAEIDAHAILEATESPMAEGSFIFVRARIYEEVPNGCNRPRGDHSEGHPDVYTVVY